MFFIAGWCGGWESGIRSGSVWGESDDSMVMSSVFLIIVCFFLLDDLCELLLLPKICCSCSLIFVSWEYSRVLSIAVQC
jgi:hypothetical protein